MTTNLLFGHVVPDRMGERYGLSARNGCGIDAATLALGYAASLVEELVDECLVVEGSHRGPASVLHLGVENGY